MAISTIFRCVAWAPFEKALLSAICAAKHADILGDIAKEKALTDSIKERIVSALDAFKKTYTA